VNRADIDIVDISAPPFLHHEIAIEAAKAGKHLFCEKPLCLTYQQAQEMYAAAEKAGIVHYLNHNYRHCPAINWPGSLLTRVGWADYFTGVPLICRAGSWIPSFL